MSVDNDLANRDFFRDKHIADDPYPYLDAAREQCPVLREPHHDVVMVTGYDEAVSVLSDAATFSSCISVTGPFPGFPVPLDGDDVSAAIEAHRDELPMNDQLPTFDPPKHTDHRALLMRLITPKRLKANESAMWDIFDGLLDGYLARGGGEFIGEVAGPFALLVIADLLGVPESDHQDFTAALTSHDEVGIGSTGDAVLEHSPLEYLYDRFTTYITDRRHGPRDDVLTGLATATFPDGSLPEVIDVVRIAANLFSAGQETSVRLMSSALMLLGERPELQDTMRADPSKIGNFIEEALRIESPIKGDFRLTRVPTEIGGVPVPAGTTVMVLNGAANRDPRQFEEPATFDPARPNARRHIAFGRGVHSCPGAPLARAEAKVCIERLLQRTTGVHISEQHHGPAGARRFTFVPTYILRGVTDLHLELTPR